ncbi:hypothetical protein [Nonomuraea ceibae]|uniref:hypothetical protein n=1 Tax=Nonomuraea ceibae TaxID=1935170 RepID=UPI001C5F406A|nr:hypothetical protein [Nonomuraea ceibae]
MPVLVHDTLFWFAYWLGQASAAAFLDSMALAAACWMSTSLRAVAGRSPAATACSYSVTSARIRQPF